MCFAPGARNSANPRWRQNASAQSGSAAGFPGFYFEGNNPILFLLLRIARYIYEYFHLAPSPTH